MMSESGCMACWLLSLSAAVREGMILVMEILYAYCLITSDHEVTSDGHCNNEVVKGFYERSADVCWRQVLFIIVYLGRCSVCIPLVDLWRWRFLPLSVYGNAVLILFPCWGFCVAVASVVARQSRVQSLFPIVGFRRWSLIVSHLPAYGSSGV
jgi:hypothetical protein